MIKPFDWHTIMLVCIPLISLINWMLAAAEINIYIFFNTCLFFYIEYKNNGWIRIRRFYTMPFYDLKCSKCGK